jgi:hypothetical protein
VKFSIVETVCVIPEKAKDVFKVTLTPAVVVRFVKSKVSVSFPPIILSAPNEA